MTSLNPTGSCTGLGKCGRTLGGADSHMTIFSCAGGNWYVALLPEKQLLWPKNNTVLLCLKAAFVSVYEVNASELNS